MSMFRKYVRFELAVAFVACCSLTVAGVFAASGSRNTEVSADEVAGLYGACGNYTSTSKGCLGCYPVTGYGALGTTTPPGDITLVPYSCSYLWTACGQYHWQTQCSGG
jgi:hypothetical protein